MSIDEEGAICDECGRRIGPSGCCATVRAAVHKVDEAVMNGVERGRKAERKDIVEWLMLRVTERDRLKTDLVCGASLIESLVKEIERGEHEG